MSQDLSTCVVGIIASDEATPIGTGFLIDVSGMVITAYHVVRAALPSPQASDSQHPLVLKVRLPQISRTVDAKLDLEQSLPESDIAVLRILEPQKDFGFAVLGPSTDTAGHRFVSVGYRPVGGGAVGTIAPHELEPKHGQFRRLVLQSDQIDRGMSGAPVLDQHNDRVVGMITAVWYASPQWAKDYATAYAVPSEAIFQACPMAQFSKTSPSIPSVISERTLHNLPRLRRAFPLHEEQLTLLRQLYCSDARSILISGPPGVGKSRLASILGHEIAAAGETELIVWVPEYVLATNLNEVLDLLAGILREPDLRRLPIREKEFWLCSELERREALVIFDGLDRDANGSVSSFVDRLPSKIKTVVTSRRDSIIETDERLVLAFARRADALDFLHHAAAGKRMSAASEEEIDKLYEVTAGLPMALDWAAVQINSGRRTYENVVETLERGVDSISHRLYNSICDDLSPEEMNLVGVLTFLPSGAGISFLASCLAVEPLAAEQMIVRLVEEYIVEPSQEIHRIAVTYSLSRPFRSFVRAGTTRKTSAMISKFEQVRAYYKEYVAARSFMYKRNSDAYRELERNYENIESVIGECISRGMTEEACNLSLSMSYFYAVSGRWGSRIDRFETLLKVGHGQLTPEREAWILINELGYMYISREEWDSASTAISNGLALLEGRWAGASSPKVNGKSLIPDEANVNFMRVIALRYLGLVTAGKNNPEQGVEHLRDAIGKFLHMQRRTIAANTSIELGETYLLSGNPELSRQAFEEGIEYHLAQADSKPWVNTWIARGELGLGNIEFRKGELNGARSHYEEAATRSMIVDNVDTFAMATRRRAIIAEAMGDIGLALNLANAARAGFVRVGKGEAAQMMSDLIDRCGG